MPVPAKKIKLLSESRVICENPDSLFHYFAWPTVTRLPDGRLMLVSSGFRMRHVCPFGKVAACYSEDEGETWSAPEILFNSPLDDRDAGIAVDGDRVIVTTFNNTVAMQREECKAVASPEYRDLVNKHLDAIDAEKAEKEYLGSLYLLSADGGKTFSSPKKIPITAPHGPCVTPDGKFLYVGRYYGKNENDGNVIGVYQENETGEFVHLSDIPNVPADEGGTLLTVFYDHKCDGPAVIKQIEWSIDEI